ncbi:MAG TPA: hypothetical protein VLD85_10250 [Anaeromyxobacteraceae bacterium]|nr:hypothetical protein [Anaeromyxobacteraceae bacterium]
MSSRTTWLLPLLLATACSSGVKALSARYSAPAALAPFAGYTTKRPGELHRYLAVASARSDEIRILDPEDGTSVASPGLVFPLSVPTPAPARLASASLGDGGADLLAVAGMGSSTVGVVTTWRMDSRVSPVGPVASPVPADPLSLSVDLSTDADLGDGAVIVSLAAMTTPAAALPAGAHGARVLLGLSTRQLAVVEYLRDDATGGLLRVDSGSALPKQALGVQPLAMAVEPGGSRIFVATDDPLLDRNAAPVQGVAQVDASQGVAVAWPVVGLDAHGPTRLVAAGFFAERTRASSRAYGAPQLDVVAVLDESSCGPDRSIDCGLVTLVPDQGTGGVPPDPAGELSFRAPIRLASGSSSLTGPPIDARPVALAVVIPRQPPAPDLPGDDPIPDLFDGPPPDRSVSPLLSIYRTVGTAQATAVVAVVAADGYLHLVDPSRWGVVNDVDALRGTNYARVASVSREPGVPPATLPVFGVWNDRSSGGTTLVTALQDMIPEIAVTPGYTTTDSWVVEWNGRLPGLAQRYGALQADGSRFTVAVQAADASGRWTAAARIWDGSLGIHRGDLVVVSCPDAAGNARSFTARVADFELPDDLKQPPPASPLYPGGALVLDGDGGGTCQEAPGSPAMVHFDVRAQGLLLRGARFGYVGRPQLDQTFELRWQDEAPLALAAQGDPVADGDAVRQAQETLTVVRKARRWFYPADGPCGAPGSATACATAFPAGFDPTGYDPLTPGPVIRLRVGVQCPSVDPACAANLDQHRLDAAALGSELGLIIGTGDGLVPSLRRAVLVQAMPTAVTSIDRSQYATTRSLGTEVYASFLDDEVISFSPGSVTTGSSH